MTLLVVVATHQDVEKMTHSPRIILATVIMESLKNGYAGAGGAAAMITNALLQGGILTLLGAIVGFGSAFILQNYQRYNDRRIILDALLHEIAYLQRVLITTASTHEALNITGGWEDDHLISLTFTETTNLKPFKPGDTRIFSAVLSQIGKLGKNDAREILHFYEYIEDFEEDYNRILENGRLLQRALERGVRSNADLMGEAALTLVAMNRYFQNVNSAVQLADSLIRRKGYGEYHDRLLSNQVLQIMRHDLESKINKFDAHYNSWWEQYGNPYFERRRAAETKDPE